MSLPSSERLPDDIQELSPARQRHLRRNPRAASPAERVMLVDSLHQKTAPSLDFFLFALLGALITGAMLYFREPVLLILAILVFPFPTPILSLALLPATRRLSSGLKASAQLILYLGVVFLAGLLAGWQAPDAPLSSLAIFHFSAPYWLNLAGVAVSAALICLILLRQDRLPRLLGAYLSYEIAIPLAVAGFGLAVGQPQLWPGALVTALLHLGIALVVAILTLGMLSFTPRTLFGWLVALTPLAVTLALLTASLFLIASPPSVTTPVSVRVVHTDTPVPTLTEPIPATEKPSPTHSPTAPTSTATEVPTLTATITPTPSPTQYLGVVAAPEGVIIRAEPSFAADIVTYLYDGNNVMILGETSDGNARWFQIETATGDRGWLLGSLVRTPTQTPQAN